MIAEVYPILKLPRKCTYFDYVIPADLTVAVGDLVRIPFKNREALGIVRGLKDTSEAGKLLAVNSVAKRSYVTAADLARYDKIATALVQAVSSILHATFPTSFYEGTAPTVQATSVSHVGAHDIPVLEHCLDACNLNPSVAIAGDRDIGFALAYALRRKREQQMLIILPRERDAELLARYIKLGDHVGLLHGHTSPRDRMRIQEAWRNGELKTLIGTRNVSLLPAAKLSTILILESGNNEHLNERRNPRFDAREAAKLLAKQHEAHLITFDACPRLEDVQTSELVTTTDLADESVIVNLGSADELSPDLLLSDSLLEAVEMALQSQKRVLLFLNRKGVAKRLQCGKCGHIPTCGTCGHVPIVRHDDLVCPNCQTEMWIPAQCPSCQKPKLGLRGIGGAKILQQLQQRFPTATFGQIEKGKLENTDADIVIATEFFFSSYLAPFAPKTFGLVADLAADIALHASDFRGAEETARKLHRLLNFGARQGAKVMVQTWLPEVLRGMLNLKTFTQHELELRKQYELPPFSIRYLFPDTKLEDLPPELQTLALERDDHLELLQPLQPLVHLKTNLFNLPDAIKLLYDGPYA